MDFASFISQSTNPDFFTRAFVYVFHCKEYPSLFFTQLFSTLRSGLSIQSLNLTDFESAQLNAQLSTTFLDQALFYWLGDGSALSAANKRTITNLLAHYSGPHRVAIFLNEPLISDTKGRARPEIVPINIELPEKIDANTYEQLARVLYPGMTRKPQLLHAATIKPGQQIPLDTACLLLSYEQLVGTNSELFNKTWLTQLIEPEHSLFTLSQYFLAKQSAEFMNMWQELGPQYNEQFWIIYWAEQLWRAYFFVHYRQSQQLLEAKKISARLPFSFIQRDFRKVTSNELKAAHAFLYQLDYKLKNGGSSTGLELFYQRFMSNDFV